MEHFEGNESLLALNIGKPNDFKASAGVKNDPRTRAGVKIDPRNPFTWLFLGTRTKVNMNIEGGPQKYFDSWRGVYEMY